MKKKLKIMLFYQNFIPVTQKSKLSNTIDKILRDPFWDDFESVLTNKGWYSEKSETEWILQIPVPGLTKDDLTIKTTKEGLNIKLSEGNRWVEKFDKIFTLPSDINLKGISAKVENGLLNVVIPIKEEAENLVQIK
jgi:HSP20 family protein